MVAFAQWWRPVGLLGLSVGLGAAACPKNDSTGPTVTSVVITPSAVSLHPGQQATFYTYAKKSNGDSVAATVTYSATGGSISSSGVFIAGGTIGSYHAIAKLASGTMADTASITIDSVPPAPVATVTVTPAHPSIAAGTTISLTATTKDSNGAVLTGRVVTWSSGTTSVGTVAAGVVTGVSAGTTIITATSEGKQGNDTVTVTTPVATLVRINLTPDSVALDTGHTQQFTVTGKFSDSSTATVPATFSATGGSVSSSGLFTAGTTAGSFHVIAVKTGGSLADTSKVVVVANASSAAECANPQPGWIWCDDFEQDRSSSYFEFITSGGNFTREAGVGKDSSYGMRAHFAAGANSAGELHLAFGKTPLTYMKPVDPGTANYREIYWRMYVRAQAGWVGGSHDKLSRALVFAGTNFQEAAFAHVWGSLADTNTLTLDPASGTDSAGNLKTTQYNDFPNMRFLGAMTMHEDIFDAAHVGQWYCVEAHAKLNDAGQSNGIFEVWINDTLQAQETTLNWLGSFNAYGFNAIYFENYWNNGAPVAEDRFFDRIVVSTQRIGC